MDSYIYIYTHVSESSLFLDRKFGYVASAVKYNHFKPFWVYSVIQCLLEHAFLSIWVSAAANTKQPGYFKTGRMIKWISDILDPYV